MTGLASKLYEDWIDHNDPDPEITKIEEGIDIGYENSNKIDTLTVLYERRGFEAGFAAAQGCLKELLGI